MMRTYVQGTVSRCFAVLRQLRQIRHSVPTDTFQTLVVSLVLTRLDYGNIVLAGLPVYLVRRLQSVLNAAARSTYHLRRSDHISDALDLRRGTSALSVFHTCRRPTQSPIAAFCRHQSPGSAYQQTVDCW